MNASQGKAYANGTLADGRTEPRRAALCGRRPLPKRPADKKWSVTLTANEKPTGNSNPGNFANDRQKASEAGRSGGSHQGRDNNPANVGYDKQKAGESGREGEHPTKDGSRS